MPKKRTATFVESRHVKDADLQQSMPGPVAIALKILNRRSVECGMPLAYVLFGKHDYAARATEWINFLKTSNMPAVLLRGVSSVLRGSAGEIDRQAAKAEAAEAAKKAEADV